MAADFRRSLQSLNVALLFANDSSAFIMGALHKRGVRMRVFVSYSKRGGHISDEMLAKFAAHLTGICTPFVHALEASRQHNQQINVLWALFRCHLVIHLVSPSSNASPWVRLELALAKLVCRPVIHMDAAVLELPK